MEMLTPPRGDNLLIIADQASLAYVSSAWVALIMTPVGTAVAEVVRLLNEAAKTEVSRLRLRC